MALYYTEIVGDDGGKLAITPEQGEAEIVYIIEGEDDETPPATDELNEFVNYFNGGVNNIRPRLCYFGEANAGKVDRTLPPVHPLRNELTSAGVVDLRLWSPRHFLATSYQTFGLTPSKEQFANGEKWRATIKFIRRPYYLATNEQIPLVEKLYWPSDGGSGIPLTCAQEWRRFTTHKMTPLEDTINASSSDSAMVFRTQSGNAPNTQNFTGKVFAALELSVLEYSWFNVPYRYLDSTYNGRRTYLSRFINRVNQTEWRGYPPGSLLYLGAEVIGEPYLPVTVNTKGIDKLLRDGADTGLLCNLKLKFLYTSRQGTDVPNSTNGLYTANKNRVLAGHNLFPNFGSLGTFNYATSEPADGSDTGKNPAFKSIEFELLWTDPLLVQTGGEVTT